MKKRIHSAFTKVRGIAGIWAKPGEFTMHRCDEPHETLEAIFWHFNGFRPFERFARQFPAWSLWLKDATEFREVSEEHVYTVCNEMGIWLQERGQMMPNHYFGILDNKPGIWWNGSADADDHRDTAEVNERGNVTYYRNGRELWAYV